MTKLSHAVITLLFGQLTQFGSITLPVQAGQGELELAFVKQCLYHSGEVLCLLQEAGPAHILLAKPAVIKQVLILQIMLIANVATDTASLIWKAPKCQHCVIVRTLRLIPLVIHTKLFFLLHELQSLIHSLNFESLQTIVLACLIPWHLGVTTNLRVRRNCR